MGIHSHQTNNNWHSGYNQVWTASDWQEACTVEPTDTENIQVVTVINFDLIDSNQ